MKKYLIILASLVALIAQGCQQPIRTTSDTNQLLEEWRNDHFGMFIHFGIYSQLGGIWQGEQVPFYGEQIMNHARIPIAEFEAVARQFNPANFNADEIVSLAKDAGMKYIVITTKHHDGFCMFATKTTDYNIVDFTPYGKDVVAQLADACHRQGMKLGFYYSLPDWHYPHGIPRMAPDPDTKCWEHVNQVYSPLETVTPELEDYIVAQITELLSNYGEITTMWFDMGLITPEQSQRFRDTVKKLQPNCLINGRIMNNKGDYMTLPDNGDVASYGDVFWDNPASLYGTWGYKSWIQRPPLDQQIQRQISRLTSTVSHGGVFLLNIGPDGSGQVIDYEKEVLHGIGNFLRANPDTLDVLSAQSKIAQAPHVIEIDKNEFTLTANDGLYHAALDGTGYMSIQPHSWISWNISACTPGTYEVFVIYEPEYDAKTYTISYGEQLLTQTLPGVDRMVQTCYMGLLLLSGEQVQLSLRQASGSEHTPSALDPLGLNNLRIVLRRK